MLTRILPNRIIWEWDWLKPRCALPDILPRLLANKAGAYRIDGTDAALVLSVGLTKDTDVRALWIEMLGGKVGFRPKQNLQLMHSVLLEIGLISQQSGCVEMRAELKLKRPDWRKHVLPAVGFEPVEIDGSIVMRKALA